MKLLRFALAAFATCTAASAQTLYIDFGDPGFPVPTNTYAAAATSPGTWNAFDNFNNVWPHTMLSVVDTTGTAAPAVTVRGEYTLNTNGLGNFSFDNAGTVGDDEALMDDLVDVGAPAATFTVTVMGLADGNYNLLSYAWAPDSTTFTSTIDVNGMNPQSTMPSAWPGMHQLGFTYVEHFGVNVSGGADIVINFATLTGFGSCNGIQIIETGAPGPIGTNFGCPTTIPNSSGGPAAIAATGSDMAASNNVTLSTTGMPANQFGYYLNSMNQNLAGFNPPGSQGNLCIGPAGLGRYNTSIFDSGANGSASQALNLTMTPTPAGNVAIQAGETWYFTTWFRDNNPGSTSNFSDAVCITFL